MNKPNKLTRQHRARINRYLREKRTVSGGVNSTQILTDMATIIANLSSTQTARGSGGSPASGVIQDVPGMLKSILLNFQEAKAKINLLLYGNSIGSGTPGQSGAALQSGDSNASTTTTLLGNINSDLV